MVSHPLDQGSFGTIHECIDLNKPDSMNVIKVSENYKMLGREIEALKEIKNVDKVSNMNHPYDFVPVILSKGMFILETPKESGSSTPCISEEGSSNDDKKFLSFYVMPKYGQNLE
jgi:hypothetical protein